MSQANIQHTRNLANNDTHSQYMSFRIGSVSLQEGKPCFESKYNRVRVWQGGLTVPQITQRLLRYGYRRSFPLGGGGLMVEAVCEAQGSVILGGTKLTLCHSPQVSVRGNMPAGCCIPILETVCKVHELTTVVTPFCRPLRPLRRLRGRRVIALS
jgi:hypothetical protein